MNYLMIMIDHADVIEGELGRTGNRPLLKYVYENIQQL